MSFVSRGACRSSVCVRRMTLLYAIPAAYVAWPVLTTYAALVLSGRISEGEGK